MLKAIKETKVRQTYSRQLSKNKSTMLLYLFTVALLFVSAKGEWIWISSLFNVGGCSLISIVRSIISADFSPNNDVFCYTADCRNPKVVSQSSYTTGNVLLSKSAAFILEVELDCSEVRK